MAAEDQLDVDAMLERFRERAAAVQQRGLPPVTGPERQQFLERAQLDFQDFAMLADATWTFLDGVLTLTIDLRPGLTPTCGFPRAQVVRRKARSMRPRASSRTGRTHIGPMAMSGSSASRIVTHGMSGTVATLNPTNTMVEEDADDRRVDRDCADPVAGFALEVQIADRAVGNHA